MIINLYLYTFYPINIYFFLMKDLDCAYKENKSFFIRVIGIFNRF